MSGFWENVLFIMILTDYFKKKKSAFTSKLCNLNKWRETIDLSERILIFFELFDTRPTPLYLININNNKQLGCIMDNKNATIYNCRIMYKLIQKKNHLHNKMNDFN